MASPSRLNKVKISLLLFIVFISPVYQLVQRYISFTMIIVVHPS